MFPCFFSGCFNIDWSECSSGIWRGLAPKRTTRIWSNFPISSQFSGVELIPSGLANGNGLLSHSCSTFALFCCLACENKLKQILLSCKRRSKGIHFRFSFRRMFKKIFAQKTGRPEPREKFQFQILCLLLWILLFRRMAKYWILQHGKYSSSSSPEGNIVELRKCSCDNLTLLLLVQTRNCSQKERALLIKLKILQLKWPGKKREWKGGPREN